ncbi:asparagine synthase (glutamine-hydrolyzing) [Aquabacterium sp. A7-Y]|uniref:asparagine synthase (glutamine-hydrolyzing) n=1 Tax=Aquabacterium sp. A7-Y TaxID=1349605 RepID=UPI00223D5085|nr:asparagine synthase (glutamine-hydrolyzing) [Aquabacterium sp. A7-Y]MCW7541671.1 asparagine synthase (glutamine-hydrolyzing) [Aquabacterium sp. A7-Y]
MCGIAGIHSPGSTPPRELLQAMIRQLHHRGPDARGVWAQGPIGLAHARLSIVDLEGGTQPMHSEDGSLSLVFNGEIFNHVELRRELQALGHRFRTRSDTEVLLHLYQRHGDSFVDHLNGQFAIALWDARRERLVLARDGSGIRPLFYARQGGRLLFASEVKALFADPALPRRLDRQALGELFTCWAPLGGRSVFEGVQSLPPGHLLITDAHGTTLRRYWDWTFPAAGSFVAHGPRQEAEAAAELRERLIAALRLQLRADVPVAAYLSGGLDSSVIASLIRHHSDTPLRTFSLTFEDAEFDESAHQQALVEHLGSEHTALRCTRADIAAAFPRAIGHIESPVLRTAPVPMMLLAGQVRQAGYKVVLTGEGADEVFGGYDLFKEAKVRRFMARQPQSAWRGRLLERLYPWLPHSPTAGGGLFARRFFAEGREHLGRPGFAHLPRWTTTQRCWQFFAPELQQALAGWDPLSAIEANLPAGAIGWEPLAQDQYIEAHTLMSGYLLSSQGDRVAMAASVECRHPFLDTALIEFANRLPASWKLRGLTEKHLLKQSMAGLLPESVRQRTKQPYRAPDSGCFFEAGRPVDYVAELLSPRKLADSGYFDPPAVARLLEKCRAGRALGFGDNMAFVGIVSTLLLHEQMVDRPPAAATPAPLAALA